ncbi:hypothetical protein B0H10DRAFT_2130766 [Mycena sp. CBHHK59/15]|nr:hypothetical protein B0H10DRAFT_2130766 [Mycena sp. CBHHK59/15]
MFAVAPRLRDVRLSHLIRWSVRISLPWHQITRYKGDAYTVQATHILALAPNIEECTLIDNDAPAIPLTHRLHTLHIVNSPVSVITPPTLNVLTLPALQSLRLPAAPPLLDAAAALLVRSDAPLAALTVDNFAPTGYSEPIMALLAAAPSVRTLTLLGRVAQPEQTAAFFSALGPLLPRLQRLTLCGVAFGESFVGWLESRCAAAGADTDGLVHTARLEALSIADVHETHIAHLLRVRELAAAGTLELEDNGLAAVRVLA